MDEVQKSSNVECNMELFEVILNVIASRYKTERKTIELIRIGKEKEGKLKKNYNIINNNNNNNIINGEIENKTSVEDKPGTTAIKAYQDKQRNISR
jgi:hypothetical protein